MMKLEGQKTYEDSEGGAAENRSPHETLSQKIIGGIRDKVKGQVYDALKMAGRAAVLSVL